MPSLMKILVTDENTIEFNPSNRIIGSFDASTPFKTEIESSIKLLQHFDHFEILPCSPICGSQSIETEKNEDPDVTTLDDEVAFPTSSGDGNVSNPYRASLKSGDYGNTETIESGKKVMDEVGFIISDFPCTFQKRISRAESLYKSQYEKYIDERISMMRKMSKTWVVFGDLSDKDKVLEIERVRHLLERIESRSSQCHTACSQRMKKDSTKRLFEDVHQTTDVSFIDSPAPTEVSERQLKDDSNLENQSFALLSPLSSSFLNGKALHELTLENSQVTSDVKKKCSDIPQNASSPDKSASENSLDSVEQVRRDLVNLNSPDMITTPFRQARSRQKRSASFSEWRNGEDTSRLKLCNESKQSFQCDTTGHFDYISPYSRVYGIDAEVDDIFAASQSPIISNTLPFMRDSSHCYEQSDLRILNDTIQTTGSALDHQGRIRWKITDEYSILQEIPVNVSLKGHAIYNPLSMKMLKTTRAIKDSNSGCLTNHEILSKYGNGKGHHVLKLVNWILKLDNPCSKPMHGLIFATKLQQIAEATLCTVIDSSEDHETRLSDVTQLGKTLVICRSKEDTEVFARTFLEKSAFSVINHAMLPLCERTRKSSAARYKSFDVVLSTFDAIMSKDLVVCLDQNGHVIRKENSSDGWICSRDSDDDERFEKLSVLHSLDWRRIIFVDELGRKSFTAKTSTLRAKAALAVNSASRFLFFTPYMDGKNQGEALKRSDRNALESVADILRCDKGSRTLLLENAFTLS